MSDPSSLTIKIESMPLDVQAQSLHHWTPREVPTHILFYFTFFFFFHTYNSYPESDHILPPTTSKSIKGISFHLDSCNSLLTGLPASWLFYSLSSHGS